MNRAYKLTIGSDESKQKLEGNVDNVGYYIGCLLYTSPSPRDS